MAAKKRFIVVNQIEVDGELHKPAGAGEKPVEVELTDEQAEYPLSKGAIEPVAADTAVKAPQSAKKD